MAYIPPNSTVQYFSDLGLSRDDTLYFGSVSSKNTYFANLTKIASEESLTYVSREKGIIRSALPMSTAINIGYMRYKNTSFENFWFYAFVTNVEYTNNGLTEIHFEVDNMMTYMGVFTLGECFVERQHTVNDGIGDNIAEEGLDTGDFIVNETVKSGFFDGYRIAVVYNPDSDNSGAIHNGIYSAAAIKSFELAADANSFIKTMIDDNKIDSIVAVLMLPTNMVTNWNNPLPGVHQVNISKQGLQIDGYKPRNKKLFCYPYNMLSVSNSEGQSINYRYEFFNRAGESTTCDFSIYMLAGASPEVSLIPRNYKNVSFNYDERLNMVKFPQCAIAVDQYKANLAQKNSTFFQDAVGQGVNIAVGAATGGLTGAASAGAGLLKLATDALISNAIRTPAPTISKGRSAPDIMFGLLAKEFYFYKRSITKNYAEMIDNYFDMFGYAVRQHLTPNMNARPNWTYCKTIGCIVHGNMPSSSARDIESMFDNGVRFWKNHNNIGNYSLNNAPA